jgi:hypothetical protein
MQRQEVDFDFAGESGVAVLSPRQKSLINSTAITMALERIIHFMNVMLMDKRRKKPCAP